MEYLTSAPKGRDLLNERKPGWFRDFDLKHFDINSICDCVLARVFGGYQRGLSFLFGTEFRIEVPEEYGFCQVSAANGLMLQSEWIHIITELQAGDQ